MDTHQRLDEGLEALLEGSSDAVLRAAPDGAILWLNERARALFGLAVPTAPSCLAELERLVQFGTLDGRPFAEDERPLARALSGESLRALPCALRLRGDQAIGLTVPMALSASRGRVPGGGEVLWLLLRPLSPEAFDGSLSRELERRGLLLREMNHRIKNHLQLLSALLRMQRRAVDDPRARDALDNAGERIQALAALHGQLHSQVDPGRLDLQFLLQRLVDDLRTGLLHETRQIETQLESVEVESDQAAAVALIASELLTNAIKHGRSPSGPGRIRLMLRWRGRDAELAVSDDGPGCDPEVTQGRLGTQLVSALAQQLGGRLERSDQRPGCRVVLCFEPQMVSVAGAAA